MARTKKNPPRGGGGGGGRGGGGGGRGGGGGGRGGGGRHWGGRHRWGGGWGWGGGYGYPVYIYDEPTYYWENVAYEPPVVDPESAMEEELSRVAMARALKNAGRRKKRGRQFPPAASVDLMRQGSRALAAAGTPAALNELARRGRDASGRKLAWGPKK